MLQRGCLTHVRPDNGHELNAKNLMKWLKQLPWENGCYHSFNGTMQVGTLMRTAIPQPQRRSGRISGSLLLRSEHCRWHQTFRLVATLEEASQLFRGF